MNWWWNNSYLPLRKSPSEANQQVAGGLREDENLLGDISGSVHVTIGVAIAGISRGEYIDALSFERQRRAAPKFMCVIYRELAEFVGIQTA